MTDLKAGEMMRGKVLKARRVIREINAGAARALRHEEIQSLKAHGNFSSDPSWDNVRVFGSEGSLVPACIRNCTFEGNVFLGNFHKPCKVSIDEGVKLPSGLYNSNISDCIILDNARVSGCELIKSTYIEPEASVIGCGIITCSGETTFGNGYELPIAVETGGREIGIFAEMDFPEASKVVAFRGNDNLLREHKENTEEYVDAIKFDYNIICSYASISSVSYMKNIFVGEFAAVSSSHILTSTILSSEDNKSQVMCGSDVRDTLIQYGCSVDSGSIVEQSVMFTHSYVEKNGKLLKSMLGPLSSVAEGEVSSSFVGPLVGFHHQAGLIACYWPSGKGNVGFGANVGSNHTGKAPDQELWAGEGVFFGLGCCIKYPCNLTKSPYTLIASGVVTLPQKVEFPFALITGPTQSTIDGISPAINCIYPAWVLHNSLFTVFRSQYKFRKRAEKLHKIMKLEYKVFRRSTIMLMQVAKERLEHSSTEMFDSTGKPVYTDKHIKGLGKNYMTEEARSQAISAYEFFIQYYALGGLWTQLILSRNLNAKEILQDIYECSGTSIVESESILNYAATGFLESSDQTDTDSDWEYQKLILREWIVKEESKKGIALLRSLVEKYAEMSKKIVKMVENCKGRDDLRGRKIIPGYAEAHEPASKNEVTVMVSKEMSTRCKEIELFLLKSEMN